MARPKNIELLLKLKQIKPDLEFRGADKRTYEEFLEEQAENRLIDELVPKKKKTSKKTKKVKQTIPQEIVEIGSEEPTSEIFDTQIEESVSSEETDQ